MLLLDKNKQTKKKQTIKQTNQGKTKPEQNKKRSLNMLYCPQGDTFGKKKQKKKHTL